LINQIIFLTDFEGFEVM